MVRREVWQRVFVLLILVGSAMLFYSLSAVQQTAKQVDGSLVFTNQYTPLIEQIVAEQTGIVADQRQDEKHQQEKVSHTEGESTDEEVVAAMATSAEETAPTTAVSQRLRSFDQFRLSRMQERARRIETIESMIESEVIGEERRDRLHEELLSLSTQYEMEEQAEGLLVARGLADAVVVIGSNGAEVIVSERITRDQAGQIGNVVARISGMSLNQITIVDGAPAQ